MMTWYLFWTLWEWQWWWMLLALGVCVCVAPGVQVCIHCNDWSALHCSCIFQFTALSLKDEDKMAVHQDSIGALQYILPGRRTLGEYKNKLCSRPCVLIFLALIEICHMGAKSLWQTESYFYYNHRLASNKPNAPKVSIKGWVVMQRVASMPVDLVQLGKLERDVVIDHKV